MVTSTLLERFAEALPTGAGSMDSLERAAVLLADHLVVRGHVDSRGVGPGALAARAAIAASRDDRDDVDWTCLVHPGAPVWAASLAIPPRSGRPGPTALASASAGYAVAVRLGHALELAGGDPRFHRTALVTPAAVAAAVSIARGGIDVDALGHALSLAGGSSGALLERSGTRAVHRGAAVLIGFASADASRDGLAATRRDLERGGGALPALSGAAADALTEPIDGLLTTSVRVLPTSGWNQTAFEAARSAAAAAGGGRVLRIDAVVATVVADRSAAVDEDPWHSLPLALARGAGADGHALDAITVETAGDPASTVTVETERGRATRTVRVPLDHPTRRAGIADLGEKWGLDAERTAMWLAELRDWLSGTGPGSAAPAPPRPPRRKETP